MYKYYIVFLTVKNISFYAFPDCIFAEFFLRFFFKNLKNFKYFQTFFENIFRFFFIFLIVIFLLTPNIKIYLLLVNSSLKNISFYAFPERIFAEFFLKIFLKFFEFFEKYLKIFFIVFFYRYLFFKKIFLNVNFLLKNISFYAFPDCIFAEFFFKNVLYFLLLKMILKYFNK